ncbi:MAG TPA: hypothetical protein VEK57_01620 [Thermoanaerobaculia bacterium]|nr:hypothetical protein [Thermoanaerobaculia bacterium]
MDEYTWFEIDELAARVGALVPGATVKATYSAGQMLLEQSGSPASLWVGICNSAFNDRSRSEMEAAAEPVVSLALGWLREEKLTTAGTTIHVAFADSTETGFVASMNVLETMRYRIGEDGSLSSVASHSSEREDDLFRRVRYRLSGRK